MKKLKALIWVGALVCLLVSIPGNSLTSWIKGELIDARTLVSRVTSKYLAQCTLEEARSALESLGAEKKSALINFLGEEGKSYLLSQCQGEVCNLVKSLKPAGKISEAEFQKLYPGIISQLLNRLPLEKYQKVIAEASEEIGPEGIFIDWQGQEILWGGLEPSRHQAILDITPEWTFLEIGLRHYAEIKDYTSIMYKQERLGKELQGVETILLKYREKPKGIYMKWLEGPWKGRELLYNEMLSKDKVRVRESGMLGVIPVWIHYTSPIARRGTNHTALEVGLKFILDLNLREYKKASANKELARKNHGIQTVDGRRVYVMESIMTRNNPQAKYYCHRQIVYMDYQKALLPKVEIYNWENQLYESYTYTKLKLNPGLTDQDFDPNNPDYRL